jgi:hypothetical protein
VKIISVLCLRTHLSRISGKKTSCNVILQESGKDRRYIFNEWANSSAKSILLESYILDKAAIFQLQIIKNTQSLAVSL